MGCKVKFSLMRQNVLSAGMLMIWGWAEGELGRGRMRLIGNRTATKVDALTTTVWRKNFVRGGYTRPRKEEIVQRHTQPKETMSEKRD